MGRSAGLVRTLAGAIIGPLAPGAVFVVLAALEGKIGEGLWAFNLATLAGYPAMLVAGMPIHFLFRYLKWTSFWIYSVAGICIAWVVAAILFSTVRQTSPDSESLFRLLFLLFLTGLVGWVAAVGFWVVARPDMVNMSTALEESPPRGYF